ncbi:MAG TPA: hypothetical protein VN258_16055 [Mobilitalea sp.]|nr:hypothetical protein [Mobilitalea sp.]
MKTFQKKFMKDCIASAKPDTLTKREIELSHSREIHGKSRNKIEQMKKRTDRFIDMFSSY